MPGQGPENHLLINPHPPSDPPKKAFLVTGIFMLGKRWLGKIMVQIIDQ